MRTISKDLLEGFLTEEDTRTDYKPQETPEIKDDYKQSSMEGLLKELQDVKIMSIKEVMEDIEDLIQERKDLQQEVFKDINGLLLNMNNFLAGVGEKIDAVEKLKVRQKLIEIEEFKMQEKINAFRDIAALKKELRDRTQEYKEKQTNVDVIDQLLG